MKSKRTIYLLVIGLMLCLSALGATKKRVQSPKDATSNPVTTVAPLPPMPSVERAETVKSASGVLSNYVRTVNYRFAWSPVSNAALVTNYTLHYGIAPRTYTNVVNAGTNLTATISNLSPRLRYYVAAKTSFNTGFTSDFSPEVFVPVPSTNYITVSILTNGRPIVSLTYTNPPEDVVMFDSRILNTNEFVSVVRLDTGTLVITNR